MQITFRTLAFPPYPDEETIINPGRSGKRLAEFLQSELPAHGFPVTGIFAEDWGWCVEVANDGFRLWVGYGNQDGTEDGFICFIEPSRPFMWRWFRRIDTKPVVVPLADAIETVLLQSGKVSDLCWSED